MLTYTAASLQSYFEPRVEESPKSPLYGATNGGEDPNRNLGSRDGAQRHVYVSPASYVTPVQAPIPQCYPPDPLSPSPYVVNHKRRGNEWIIYGEAEVVDLDSGNGGGYLCSEEVGENFAGGENLDTFDIDEDKEDNDVSGHQGEEETDNNGKEQIASWSFASAQRELFDANDEFSSDGSTSRISSCGSRNEPELNAIRLVLLEEIERRKNVEENLTLIQEVARRRQERKNSRRRWLLTFMGFSIAIGTSFVAYSYIPQSSKYLPSFKSGNSTDAACIGPHKTC